MDLSGGYGVKRPESQRIVHNLKERRNMKRNKKIKLVVLSDWHVPFEDKQVVKLELEYCKVEQPDIIVMHELHDFYAVSKFSKDPARKFNLQDEIDQVNVYMKKMRELCPNARLILLKSNHLDRLRKYIWNVAPELSGLRCMKINELLELKKYGIEYKDSFSFKKVLFKHGDIVRKFSCYTSKGEFDREGCSGSSGHTHRLGIYFIRLRGGEYVWVETGCACKRDPHYIDGITNWQHGFAVFGFDRNSNRFYPAIVPIINGRFDWGDTTFD